MSTKDANIALLSTIPENAQQKIFLYLTQNYCAGNPFKPKAAEEVYLDLKESKKCYEQGEYEEFDVALDDISKRYGL